MDVFKAIRQRKSVRRYADKSVPKSDLELIVDAGHRAPTARNEQPWEFVVVTESDLLQKIGASTDYGQFIADAAACVIVFCQDTKYYLEDGSAAVENMLLAATGLGIASCWVAGDKKAYAEDIKKLVNAPDSVKLIAMIPLGYPTKNHSDHPKRSLEKVLHWESY